MIFKGEIASIDEETNTARIIPDDTPQKTFPGIVIPDNLRERIRRGTRVIFAYFTDGEGIILSRMDGENNG